jgi:hypothetical protein
VSKGDDLSDEHTSEGGTGEHKTEELKDSIIDLVLSAPQREEVWREACPDARKHHEERCVKEVVRMEELVAAFRGGSARLSITADKLENVRQWARDQLEPWARQQREDRLARWWKAEMEPKWMRVRFRGILATNLESACALLEQAGISIAKDECQTAGFEVGQRRGSTSRTTVLEATVLLDDNLRQVWKGSRMVNKRRLVCEESQGVEEEDEQTKRIVKLSPTNPYAADMLQKWVQIWHTLGVDEIDINKVILLSVSCYLPDWQGEAVQNWSPSAQRPLRGVWEGTGAGQGQIRLRGAPIPAQHRNTHQLREVHAVRSQQAFDEREKGDRHHLPEGAGRRQRRDKIRLGIPHCDVLQEKDADRSNTLTTMLGSPGWLKDVQIPVWWEPLVPGSAMERGSSVCIRFDVGVTAGRGGDGYTSANSSQTG